MVDGAVCVAQGLGDNDQYQIDIVAFNGSADGQAVVGSCNFTRV